MKFTVVADVQAESLDDAAERLAVLESLSTEALLLVEGADDLLLVHELRERGLHIKAACVGRSEKRLISPGTELARELN
ncbi:MAG TPA: hypothetical protein VG204_14715 [Terriglobia bacterium]|nr:hypothetical protein [Terriglobia bacterium]